MSHTMSDTVQPVKPAGRGPVAVAGGAFLLLVLVGIVFLIPKLHHNHELADQAVQTTTEIPVHTVVIASGTADTKLDLPGTVQAFEQTPVFARTSGYVTKRFVDIGDHVKRGQLLAIIEDPTTQQSLRQAQATVLQMKAQLMQQQANAKLSTANGARWQQLYQAGVVSKVDAETRTAESGANDAAVEAARANIAAAEANVRSLEEQAGFSRVTAPFAGIVLSRNIDTGSLISSGSLNSVTQMFTIGQASMVRIFANVPQSMAGAVSAAKSATIHVRELPGRTFPGTITRTSNSLDPATRTLLTEIDLPNPDGKILPGMYADVQFDTPLAMKPVLLPANALVVRSVGPQAVVMDANHIVHYRAIVLGRDFGAYTEVVSGLKPGDVVVISPGDAVVDGAKVEPEKS
ncbi:efflux RND transporter periplasmic adaptor subunit [Terriglobus saanensis]|uniref:Efflux transporter, RND family, MFP subunit n=1 Tax=Terriglobus saanensis (strain ATCC BAA-1853 / DSM 23119 / SP1PR4) TaxID=401053 RepID=E8UZ98_TERSS|nr:efflux RND transporter periplasmic adaptor subunit [Terriglobus saanensis]ADV82116.1 efflux transporter, RND family, MFP subunit [Terriglobus saanensis SP1PR4]